ncbi:MAG: hypothetical protein RR139_02270 [Lachnospiraceae bacterium]
MKTGRETVVMQLQIHDKKTVKLLLKEDGAGLMAIISKHLFTLPHLQLECMTDIIIAICDNIEYLSEENDVYNWIHSVARYRCMEFLKKYQPEATIAWLIQKEIEEEQEVMLSCLNKKEQDLFLQCHQENNSQKHTMYELLNHIDTDIYEYETVPFLLTEMEQVLESLNQHWGRKSLKKIITRYVTFLSLHMEKKNSKIGKKEKVYFWNVLKKREKTCIMESSKNTFEKENFQGIIRRMCHESEDDYAAKRADHLY